MKKNYKNILVLVLAVISLVFIAQSLDAPMQVALKELESYKWQSIFISIVLLIATMFLKSIVHIKFFFHYDDSRHREVRSLSILHSYFIAQIIRYIPGKIVGIAAQSMQLKGRLDDSTVWITNILQYGVTNYNSVVIIFFCIAAIQFESFLIFMAGLVISFTMYFVLNHWWVVLKFFKKVSERFSGVPRWTFKEMLYIWSLLQLEWVFFLAGIAYLTPEASITKSAIVLGLLYSFSSITASLAIVMPAGLLIRESVFIWSSSQFGYDADLLLFLGIMLRIVLTISDIMAYFIFMPCKVFYEKKKK